MVRTARLSAGGIPSVGDAEKTAKRRRARAILKRLSEAYPDARCGLNFQGSFQLLVASILSAQCTDERVNRTTPALFRKYPTPAHFARAGRRELERDIHSCGFYRNKARHIIGACRMICEEFGGEVPEDFDALRRLPGVGRKTANILLNDGFGVPAIAVDTHVFRLSHRFGLADARDPDRTELQLREVVPKEFTAGFNHLLTFHGRRVCHARKPRCEACPV
ncbi:MAG: endonuclease III, partial [Candidatus Tectomicrobia bacterium]|nr:endonuclease III [Candidatus Tectomicrobia bacterium]